MKQKLTDIAPFDERQESALEKYLTSRGEIAIRWSVVDVLSVRPELSYEQAFVVLLECQDRHDPEVGFTWELIRLVAEDLYPVPASNQAKDEK